MESVTQFLMLKQKLVDRHYNQTPCFNQGFPGQETKMERIDSNFQQKINTVSK